MKNFRQDLKNCVKNKKPLIGTFLQLPSPEVCEIFGYCGYDFVIIDNEHTINGPNVTLQMVRAAEASGTNVIIRTPDINETNIKKALDMGANALLVPGIQKAQDVHDVIRFSKYAPAGLRGSCPGVRANHYGEGGLEFYQESNEKIGVLVQIEGKQACEEIDEILDIKELDGVLIGPVDLSMSLGHPGDVDHPEVIAMMDKIFKKAKDKGVLVAAFAMTPEVGKDWLNKGLDLLAYHIDGMMIREAAAAAIKDLR